jgi:hypothetical protein
MAADLQSEEQERWQRFKARAAERAGESFIERRRALYERTGNPIHALHAYRTARVAKIAVPDWVLKLFDQWAHALCVESPKGAKAIADALGLGTKGGPSVTSQAETEIRNLRIAERVLVLQNHPPGRDKQDVLHQAAKEFALSIESVASIWYAMRDPKP